MTKDAVAVIPARFKSTRFPGKPLVPLKGKPMILWVAERAASALGRENTFVATDDSRIADVVRNAGFGVLMTPSDAPTGTDRLWHASRQLDAKIYINVQGDEPLVDPRDIQLAVELKKKFPRAVINAYCEISADEDPTHPNLPKVVFSQDERLLYMSRAAVPGHKEAFQKPKTYHKQVCIYAFSRADLEAFGGRGKKCALELSEDIEILRFLDLGIPVQLFKAQSTLAVDHPDDVARVEAHL